MSANLTLLPSTHPHEDVFENYAFNRLGEKETADFEEHLLICETCQATLRQTDEYIQLMKIASAAYLEKKRPRSVLQFRFGDHGLRWNAAAAAILLLGCMSGLLSWRTPGSEAQAVALQARRGDVPNARANQPLDLEVDLSDVPPAPGYRVEVVDASGKRVWLGGAPARIDNGLPPGIYWVRLRTESGEFLREYGLRAR